MLQIIGWIGGIAFAICGAPQAWQSIKQGHSDGITFAFLGLWLTGEICSLIYVWPAALPPLIVNYILNILFTSIIGWYKIRPRRSP